MRVLVYTVNSRGHVVPLESPSRVYPSISMTGDQFHSVPLSSHEIDGVRKEKERLTTDHQSYLHIFSFISWFGTP